MGRVDCDQPQEAAIPYRQFIAKTLTRISALFENYLAGEASPTVLVISLRKYARDIRYFEPNADIALSGLADEIEKVAESPDAKEVIAGLHGRYEAWREDTLKVIDASVATRDVVQGELERVRKKGSDAEALVLAAEKAVQERAERDVEIAMEAIEAARGIVDAPVSPAPVKKGGTDAAMEAALKEIEGLDAKGSAGAPPADPTPAPAPAAGGGDEELEGEEMSIEEIERILSDMKKDL